MDDETSKKTAPNIIELECDDLDYEVIQRAMTIRQGMIMPDHGSNAAGALVAEICRGWLERQGKAIRSKNE